MSFNEVLTNLLGLVAGIGAFLLACDMTSKSLEAVNSSKLKQLFAKVSNNKLLGVCIGAVATATIQSSSAMTVMVIGFVNAGIISLSQAATIILGGEIGTTLTGQIVALGFLSSNLISTTVIFSSFAGIGVFINMIAKKDQNKMIGSAMAGVGLLFIGLDVMSNAMDSFAKMESLKVFLSSINSITLLVILGAVLTAIIQSSAAMTSIAITMVVSGLINIEQGIYITLGANVGTCVTGMIAGMTSGTNAKRTSMFQLLFNVSGVLLVMVVDLLIKMGSGNSISVGIIFEKMFPAMPQEQLAMFHTIFNVATVLIALPINNLLVNLSTKLIKDNGEHEEDEHVNKFFFVDEHMLTTPAIAVQQVKREIVNMGAIAMENYNISIDIIKSMNFEKVETFRANENELNFLNSELVKIIVNLSNAKISRKDFVYLTSTYRTISDIERIGDYSENIVEYAEALKENGDKFTESAIAEIEMMTSYINELYEITMDIYETENRTAFTKAKKIEQKIDDLSVEMSANHIKRLKEGKCSASSGAQYLQLASDVERIGDHLININDKDYEISH